MSTPEFAIDRCQVFDDRDRPFDGTMQYTSGKPIPESDPKSIHSGPGAGPARRELIGTCSRCKRPDQKLSTVKSRVCQSCYSKAAPRRMRGKKR